MRIQVATATEHQQQTMRERQIAQEVRDYYARRDELKRAADAAYHTQNLAFAHMMRTHDAAIAGRIGLDVAERAHAAYLRTETAYRKADREYIWHCAQNPILDAEKRRVMLALGIGE